jgi:hypothetical protein
MFGHGQRSIEGDSEALVWPEESEPSMFRHGQQSNEGDSEALVWLEVSEASF